MTIAELRADRRGERQSAARPSYSQRYTIQQKFSLPAACLVLALIGARARRQQPQGRQARRASRSAFGVVFVYYILLYSSRAVGAGRPPAAQLRAVDRQHRPGRGRPRARVLARGRRRTSRFASAFPTFWRRTARGPLRAGARRRRRRAARASSLVVRDPALDWPRPRLLDFYVARQYLRSSVWRSSALLGIFYISTFIDLADKLFRGAATTRMLLRYFYFPTPQYVYYIIPMSALVATLVTIGLLTKNSELIVMRACGISLYRSALPLVLFAALLSGVLFEMQEHVLADANREAARLNGIIRGYPTQTFGILNRRWIVGTRRRHLPLRVLRPAQRTSSTGCRSSTSTTPRGSWQR